MKITIAYLPEEARKAKLLLTVALDVIPDAKVRESDRHAPFKHTYITTRKPETDCGSKGND